MWRAWDQRAIRYDDYGGTGDQWGVAGHLIAREGFV